jgi:tetratricopeptide (TPR) repeat protein
VSSVLDDLPADAKDSALGPLLGTENIFSSDHREARVVLFDAVTRTLRRRSAGQPLVIVMEDIHAADLPSLLLLRYFADWVTDSRVTMVVTCRTADANVSAESEPILAELKARTHEKVLLSGLDVGEVKNLVTLRTGKNPGPELAQALCRDTGGNPLFIEQVVRESTESGVAWSATALPQSIQQMFSRRFARLPANVQAVLGALAVIGVDAPTSLLQLALGSARTDVISAIEAARREGLMVAAPFAPEHHAFPHALMREAIYALLDPDERARLHLATAESIQRSTRGDAGQIARHLHAGGEIERAAEFAVIAGDRAMQTLAFENAVSHYNRALASSAVLESGRGHDVRLALAHALLGSGRTAEAREAFAEIAGAARDRSISRILAEAAVGFSKTSEFAARDSAAIEWLRAAEVATRGQEDSLRVRVLGNFAMQLWTDPAAYEQRRTAGQEALQLARRIGNLNEEGFALSALLLATWELSNVGERQILTEELGRLVDRSAAPDLRVESLRWRINSSLERGQIDDVNEAVHAYTALAEELRRPQLRYNAAVRRTMLAFMAGNVALLPSAIAEVAALGRAAGDVQAPAIVGGYQFILAHELEDRDGLTRGAAVLESLARRVGSSYVRSQYGMSLVWTGKLEHARAEFEWFARANFDNIAPDMNQLAALINLANACAALGDASRASVLYERLLPYEPLHATLGAGYSLGAVAWALGRLARTAGEVDKARAHFEAAISRHELMGARRYLAEARADLAALLLEEGRETARADEMLATSAAEAKALGSTYLLRVVGEAAERRNRSLGRKVEPPSSNRGTFRRDGDAWAVGLGGRVFRVKHSRGMTYLAELLRTSQEISAVELASDSAALLSGGVGPLLDARAKSAYRERIAALREELSSAQEAADRARTLLYRAEIEAIEDEMASAHGLGGRDRSTGSTNERARAAVTLAIHRAIRAIGRHDPVLSQHLRQAVRTGAFCAYSPDPFAAVEWSLD